jgi:hypothetical protein
LGKFPIAITINCQKRSSSIASRLGNAIRAMKPTSKKSTENQPSKFIADTLTEIEECSISNMPLKAVNEDDISTQMSSSRSSSSISMSSVDDLSSLPGSIEEISMPCTSALKSELDEFALVIADRARCRGSGRVYQDVRNAFLAVDGDGDGKLTQAETVAFCQSFDLTSPEMTSRFFTLLDIHKTGLASWSSFLAKHSPVFMKSQYRKEGYQLNAGVRKVPAIH